LGYHQIIIVPEDRNKTTFATEWGPFQYTVMPFILKNVLAIFFRVVVTAFKDYIHKLLEVYFDDLTVFGLLQKHIVSIRVMLDTCRQHHISLNLKKCIFCVPCGILLGYIVCKQGLLVDLTKIEVIMQLPTPNMVKKLCTTLGHIGHYIKFIKGYAQVIALMEILLKKDVTFDWDEECQKSLDILKEKMVIVPILVLLAWNKEFHVHVDAFCITFDVVLAQLGAGEVDHPIAFGTRNMSKAEKNHSMTEREGLVMVYAI